MIFNALTLFAVSLVASAYKDPLFASGRTTFIHLFEWKWTDIAAECERFLGPNGYAGVQVSPPNEHANIQNPFRPWWQRYQPVSYKLESRSGTDAQFRDMVARCNAVGVRIYVDAVINHMSGTSGVGSGGSLFNAATKFFPGVPYSAFDFNDGRCNTASGNVEDFNDINQVRNCKLFGLPDLATGNDNVRQKIANFMNSLIDMGVAGFRIDAAKHIWPADIQDILSRLKNVRSDVFGANKRPFIYQEVIDFGNEPIKDTEYSGFARVTEFKYGKELSETVNKTGNRKLSDLKNFASGYLPDGDAVLFIDNHDTQRGHGPGHDVLSFFEPKLYKIANAFMLAWPYGVAQVMSSYFFSFDKDWQGPPSNSNGETKDVVINADGTCGDGWVCEHRWPVINNMAKFRNLVNGESIRNWWDNGSNQIAFSRGSKGFIVINNDNFGMDVTLQTGLPAGKYCDIISGNKVGSSCTGKTITVSSDGTARLNIQNNEENPMIALHIDSKI